MVSWLLRFLLFLIAFVFLKRLFSRILGGKPLKNAGARKQGFPRSPKREIQGETVRDPVCGMYVAKSIAEPLKTRQGTLYFCSEKCRDDYRNGEARE